ncbi:MAG: ferritin family protein [Methanobacteriota archaeon]|nr:MAG: ferritin family protein [Euryarchaeota archaeon]
MVEEQMTILRNAIGMEIEGKKFFRKVAERAKYPRTKEMFGSLVKQEERHVRVLEEELDRLQSGKGWIAPSSIKETGASSAPHEVFEGAKTQASAFDPKSGELEAIRLGMDIERRSIEYYRRAGDEVGSEEAKRVFNWLVGEEAGHLSILKAEHDIRSKSGFYFDNPEFSLEVM